ncbi:putative ribonuclease H protein [Glycine soja]|nr:hypothetical protein JHK87_030654 [Glycine soja]KAH1158741.1 hypothetical protein GYH30_030785 [Glycine max]
MSEVCDGAVMEGGSKGACGSLVRDHTGAFLCGVSINIGKGSVLEEELKGILFGLKLAWSRGYRRIRVDSDSLVAIKLMSKGCCMRHPFYNLVQEIHAVHGYQGNIYWNHVLREANQVADALAKKAITTLSLYQVFDFPPSCIVYAL